MPHFRISNIDKLVLQEFLDKNLAKISSIMGAPNHYINFRISNDEFVSDSQGSLESPIYVEVNMLARSNEVRKQIVTLFHQYFINEAKINKLIIFRFSTIAQGDFFDNLSQF